VRVLVVNAGSSSVKLRLLDAADRVTGSIDLPAEGGRPEPGAVRDALGDLGPADAAGHRVVHGGAAMTGPVRVDDAVVGALRELAALAPLHEAAAIEGIEAVAAARPGLDAVACFDTAFHAGLPAAASTYALPGAWRQRWPIRRYGFHGLSHEWAARRVGELLGRADLRLVSCHLGSGASLAAVRGGRSVDTTMGFTPLEGLVMATRSGSVDPGLLLWLLEEGRLDVAELSRGLEHGSGLRGLTGDADARAVVARAAAGDEEAALGLDVAAHRLRAGIAAMAAALGGLDAIAFTGGVGEHQPVVRAGAVDGLGFLGVALDEAANAAADGEAVISPPGCPVAALVVPSREDLVIAGQVRAVLAGGLSPPGPAGP
jgi:acetate kinase